MEEEMRAGAEESGAANETSGFSAEDLEKMLVKNGWLAPGTAGASTEGLPAWIERAAILLGPQTKTEAELEDLLRLVFHYDAARTMADRTNQDVLVREGAREVIRELANRVLQSKDVDSDRFKEIVEELKRATPYRSRELFQPIRVALAGRAGGGELDRVILLLDSAAKLNFAAEVKGARQRMLEFCATLD